MPTCRAICTDALVEIGVVSEAESMTAPQGAFCLLRLQHLIDAWQAQRITLALQRRTQFTLPNGLSTATLGPAGGTVTMVRPVWVDTVTYIVPGSSPVVEVPLSPMDLDSYAALSIKFLRSALPTRYFYQTSLDTVLGSLFIYPRVTQAVDLVVYNPEGLGVPATLDSLITGPPGYQQTLVYQLALRLVTPFGVEMPAALPSLAKEAWDTMARTNVSPGLLSVDPALVGTGAGYNIYSDGMGRSR